MGAYYLIVNPLKREYLDPGSFGEGFKFPNLLNGGFTTLVLKSLISDDRRGRWVGDPVILAADDGGLPNPGGLIKTTTEERPDRNLNALAREEFADVSYRLLASIAGNEAVADELVAHAAHDSGFLVDLGAVLEQYNPCT